MDPVPSRIVTVTPNGSVDTVLRRMGPPGDEEQDVVAVARTGGGKGHNVARFLVAEGRAVTACGFAGGWAGQELEALLREASVVPRLTPIEGETRRYTTCLGDGLPRQSLHAQGPEVTAAECGHLIADVAEATRGAVAVVLAGSLPPGAPADLFAVIIREVAPVPVILDTAGAALVAGVAAQPWMVKVNVREFDVFLESSGIVRAASAGTGPAAGHADPGAWPVVLSRLVDRSGVGSWWVTLGPGGAAGWMRGEAVSVAPPRVAIVNTTGAGDAFLAGLLLAELDGENAREAAVRAVAMATALCEQEAPLPPEPSRVMALRSTMVVR